MREVIQWLKPGTRVKRYILLQIVSIAIAMYSIIMLFTRQILSTRSVLAYIFLISISLFFIIFSFLLAQKNILSLTLKNISNKSKNLELKKLIYADPTRNKGPRIVIIGGGSGLSNILYYLKDYTTHITTVIDVSESEEINNDYTKNAKVTPGDIRKCIAALSVSDGIVEKVLTHRVERNGRKTQSVGSMIISSMISEAGSFQKAIDKIPDFFKIEGQILPVTMEETSLCAGLENGEIVTGKNNISPRISEIKSGIRQVFLKDGSLAVNPKVLEAIKNSDMIIIGPGSLYSNVISSFLLSEMSNAIVSSRAKKVFISNLMNSTGETDGYTLSKHVNEIERYLGKHVLDYVIANNGEITDEMVKDFNQGKSTPLTIDIENIQNRTISVIEEDLVLTAPSSIIHNAKRVCELLMNIIKTKKSGDLNIVKLKKKHLSKNFSHKKIDYSKTTNEILKKSKKEKEVLKKISKK